MDYKDEMRRLIDVVKQMGLDAPLEQTLDDLKVMTSATKELSDRIEMRVRKSLQPADKDKGKVVKGAKRQTRKRTKQPIASLPTPKPKQPNQSNNALPTSTQPTSSAVSQLDYNKSADNFRAQQKNLAPIRPQPPLQTS